MTVCFRFQGSEPASTPRAFGISNQNTDCTAWGVSIVSCDRCIVILQRVGLASQPHAAVMPNESHASSACMRAYMRLFTSAISLSSLREATVAAISRGCWQPCESPPPVYDDRVLHRSNIRKLWQIHRLTPYPHSSTLGDQIQGGRVELPLTLYRRTSTL